MKKIIILFLFLIFSFKAQAGCDDALGDGVDYTNCRFSDGQDLEGSFLPNSNLSFTSFIQVNFDKSIMMNSILAYGTFSDSTHDGNDGRQRASAQHHPGAFESGGHGLLDGSRV